MDSPAQQHHLTKITIRHSPIVWIVAFIYPAIALILIKAPIQATLNLILLSAALITLSIPILILAMLHGVITLWFKQKRGCLLVTGEPLTTI